MGNIHSDDDNFCSTWRREKYEKERKEEEKKRRMESGIPLWLETQLIESHLEEYKKKIIENQKSTIIEL